MNHLNSEEKKSRNHSIGIIFRNEQEGDLEKKWKIILKHFQKCINLPIKNLLDDTKKYKTVK